VAAVSLAGCHREEGYETVMKGRYGLECFRLARMRPGSPRGPESEADWRTGQFSVALAVGDIDNAGRDVCEVLHVDGSGKCEYRYADRSIPGRFVRKRALFQVSDEEVRSLRRVISEMRFFQLAEEYNADIADGPRVFVNCKVGKWTKTVNCFSYFPDEIVQIHDYLKRDILERHAKELHDEETGREDSGRHDYF
jgi:hypothetical protein